MIRSRRGPSIAFLSKTVDLMIALAAIMLASLWARHLYPRIGGIPAYPQIAGLARVTVLLAVSHLSLVLCGIYRSRRLSRHFAELRDLLVAALLNAAACVVLASAADEPRPLWVALLLYLMIWGSALSVARLFMRTFLGYVRSCGGNRRHLLIIGTNGRALEFARKLEEAPNRGYHLVGFVDTVWPGLDVFNSSGFHRVATYEGLSTYLRHAIVDEIAVFLPVASYYKYCAEIAGICEQYGIIMRLNADLFGNKLSRWRHDRFEGDAYVTAYPPRSSGWGARIKRLVDVFGSLFLLTITSPPLLAVALGIKLTCSGPILFAQDRVGLNKRVFRIYKFRTMIVEAERLMQGLESENEMTGPAFKIKHDPRITPIGRLLRRTSVDELPQLVNVLRGDMSLVGPRPLALRDYNGFSEDWQRRRFSVKPGLTCLWQISGRNTLSFDQWMLLDLQYMDEWSLWLDLKILAKTVPAVMRGEGAT